MSLSYIALNNVRLLTHIVRCLMLVQGENIRIHVIYNSEQHISTKYQCTECHTIQEKEINISYLLLSWRYPLSVPTWFSMVFFFICLCRWRTLVHVVKQWKCVITKRRSVWCCIGAATSKLITYSISISFLRKYLMCMLNILCILSCIFMWLWHLQLDSSWSREYKFTALPL